MGYFGLTIVNVPEVEEEGQELGSGVLEFVLEMLMAVKKRLKKAVEDCGRHSANSCSG